MDKAPIYLVEFAYNAAFQRSIKMSPFKALYGEDCLTPLKWTNPLIRVQVSKDMLDKMQYQTNHIFQEIKAALDIQKSYVDLRRSDRIFKEGGHGFSTTKPK